MKKIKVKLKILLVYSFDPPCFVPNPIKIIQLDPPHCGGLMEWVKSPTLYSDQLECPLYTESGHSDTSSYRAGDSKQIKNHFSPL